MTCTARIAGLLGLLLPLMAVAQEAAAPATVAPEPAQAQIVAEPEMPAIVQVTGVETLADYAAVGRLLGAVEGVRRVDVTEAEGVMVTFHLLVRGGSSTLERGLGSSGQLVRSATSGGRLVYEYRR